MSISEKIKFFRLEKGLSQSALAEKSNLTKQSIYSYENNRRRPSAEILNRVAKALNVEVSDFFDKSPPTTTPSNAPTPLLFEVLGNLKYADDDTLKLINHLLLKSK